MGRRKGEGEGRREEEGRGGGGREREGGRERGREDINKYQISQSWCVSDSDGSHAGSPHLNVVF